MHVVAWYQNERGGPGQGSVRFVARGEAASQEDALAWLKRIQAAHEAERPVGYIWAFDAWDQPQELQGYQERVIVEKADLDTRLAALRRFIDDGFTAGLPMAEKLLLISQRLAMQQYSAILGERIALFLARRPAVAPTESV